LLSAIEVGQTGATHDFNSNEAVEARVAGFVHGAYSAFPSFATIS
jgi:hypothetical protein